MNSYTFKVNLLKDIDLGKIANECKGVAFLVNKELYIREDFAKQFDASDKIVVGNALLCWSWGTRRFLVQKRFLKSYVPREKDFEWKDVWRYIEYDGRIDDVHIQIENAKNLLRKKKAIDVFVYTF